MVHNLPVRDAKNIDYPKRHRIIARRDAHEPSLVRTPPGPASYDFIPGCDQVVYGSPEVRRGRPEHGKGLFDAFSGRSEFSDVFMFS